MVKPDFTKIWAGSRVSIPTISSPDYVKGFAAYLGPLPPQTDDHDYIMNLQDLRALWLEQELATKTASATDTTAGIVQLAVAANYPSASDTEVATPAYVASAVAGVGAGVYSSNQVITTGTTFSIAHVGRAIEINAAGATSHNMPAASAYASGKAISFANINTGIATFNRAGSDTITGGNLAAATSIPLNKGETVTLVSDGSSTWYVAASNVKFFGAPRAWAVLTATRLANTPYTNTTGREIDISGYFNNGSGATVAVVVDGLTRWLYAPASGVVTMPFFGTIPNGSIYSINIPGTFGLYTWNELR